MLVNCFVEGKMEFVGWVSAAGCRASGVSVDKKVRVRGHTDLVEECRGGYYPLDVILRKLSFDSGDAGEDFTLNGFEQCAATGRYVRNFVGEAEFVYASNGVAAANE